ncbi:MAG: arginine--tRNA ligase [Coxiellaceae bacterium]|nr:arginine--tRNA ligase [Coxiellaceae bacterium]
MKQLIADLLGQAINNLQQQGVLHDDIQVNIMVDHCRDKQHGDFASNLAMTLAKVAKTNPRQLAEQIVAALPANENITDVSIAGPGFINFTIASNAQNAIVNEILKQQNKFGLNQSGKDTSIHIEYVSANPTGPLHVGHGRGAAYGACTANLLIANGYKVHREYYVNDAGRQMRILAVSIWLRYLQLASETIELPPNAYQGQYIVDIAQGLLDQKGHAYSVPADKITELMPEGLSSSEDKEAYIDAIIDAAKKLLSDATFAEIKQFGLDQILDDIKDDLHEFGVDYDEWYPESQLYEDGSFEKGIQLLTDQGFVYEKDGAKWFKATDFGDDKDRVLIRENGQPTYFASDVAYHLHSYNHYDQVIDVLGADHHGYIARLQAFLKGLGKDPGRLLVLLVQFAVLYRGDEKVQMSTRSGEFVTLRQLRDEVGNDAARFFYIMRKPEQHLDFDLKLATSKTNENPVYYIQYAHARICSVMRKLKEQSYQYNQTEGLDNLDALDSEHEKALLQSLSRYQETILKAGHSHAPHQVAHYLYELANQFHSYYNNSAFIIKEDTLRNARLALVLATKQVILNGMTLLGVSCPDQM